MNLQKLLSKLNSFSDDLAENVDVRVWYVMLVIGMFLFVVGLRMIG